MIANTPAPPYYAVIFTNLKEDETEGYAEMADKMESLAAQKPGYLGIEHAGDKGSITISYWKDEESILNWKQQSDHQEAQQKGIAQWYKAYKTRVCYVARDYGFERK